MRRSRLPPSQSSGDLQPNLDALEEGETQQDTEMVEELDSSEEEVKYHNSLLDLKSSLSGLTLFF